MTSSGWMSDSRDSVPRNGEIVRKDDEPDWGALLRQDVRPLLVVGAAACVWDDLARLGSWPHHIVVVNQIGIRIPAFQYWASLHPEFLIQKWLPRRKELIGQVGLWSHKTFRNVDLVLTDWNGSSGLFAVKCGLVMGYNRIVCAGTPLDDQHHFNIEKRWPDCLAYRKAWIKHQADLKPFVRSLSGWTRDLLGEPTEGWLTNPASRMPITQE